MLKYPKSLGYLALLFGFAVLSGCGGGSGTDNKQVDFPSCRDPEVLLDNGQCGLPRDPYVPPACPTGEIRNDAGDCVVPDFPTPEKLPGENEVVIYVNVDSADKNADFASYNLHLWQDCGNGWASSVTDGTNTTYAIPTTWPNGPHISSHDTGEAGVRHDPYYGAFFVIPTSALGSCGNFIVKTPNGAAQTNDLSINIKRDGGDYDRMMWVIVNTQNMRNSRVSTLPICINDVCTLEQPAVSISGVEAHWIGSHTIVWDREFAAGKRVDLYHSTAGGMAGEDDGSISGGELLAQLSEGRALTDEEKAQVPQLADYYAYDLPDTVSLDAVKAALKDELLIVGRYDSEEESGTVERARATRIQVAEVLDQLYTSGDNDADEAQLGVNYGASGISTSVWAPTAQKVELRIYSGDPLRVSATADMSFDSNTGIWSYTGTAPEMDRKFYRFRVTAYNPLEKKVLRLEVSDPYSISLASNGRYSQFVNLDDDDTKPAGWDAQVVPAAGAPEAASIYEAHVRDFSVSDASTTAAYRGKYMAFTQTDSVPMQHLQALADAGLTYVHLLPVADGSSIKEDFSSQANLDSYVFDLCQRVSSPSSVSICDGSISFNSTLRSLLESYDPESTKARELEAILGDLDGFNWNYDPEHYFAPDGSYATNSQGETRIKEMRAMNQALHSIGLRVVMDVVYPHTAASGVTAANSVFDKIVPGYYYRTNAATNEGENGTGAGNDTATEHRMMAKLMKDSLLIWASEYKVDGFRFDQSGFMPKAALVEAYDAVKAIDPDNYFYAEAWTPGGGTSGERISERSTQEELAGTGIGTFNDRIRNPLQQMALIKGNDADAIRAGIAGNLKDFQLKTKSGVLVKAETVGAYNLDPQEAINYAEKHDNETLWDWMHRPDALPTDMTLANRVRVDSLTQSVVLLSQGVPFFQMGSELLRSKSMCPNSYNAGDWFNTVDFTMASNNWGVGVPAELHPNEGLTDEYVAGMFANPNTKPGMAEIEQANAVFMEFLKIASGSPLFSLTTAADVMDRLGFHDGGKTQVPGLIVFSLDDGVGTVAGTDDTARADLDANVDAIVVVVNGTDSSQSAKVNTATGFALHSVQQNSADAVVKTASFAEADGGGVFTVPAYTTAVFVKAQAGAQGDGLSATATIGKSVPVPYGTTSIYLRGDITAGGWDAVSANQMHYDGGGIYSLLAEALSGPRIFKVAEANWSSPNLGGAIVFDVGDSATLTQGSNDNLSMNLAANQTLRFVLDASSSVTAPTLSVIDPDTFGATGVYLRGEVTASGWGADSGNQVVYEGDSIYALSVTMVPGTYAFKVASSDWSTFNLGAAASVTLGEDVTLTQGSNDNLSITIASAGTYRFEVDTRDASAPKVRVYVDDIFAATPVYVRGDITASGWGADAGNLMSYAGAGRYTFTTSIAAGSYVFKLAETNWSNPNLGAQSATVGEPTVLTQGSNDNIAITIPATGDYTFTLDTRAQDAMTVTVTAD